jgi:hypothetical protein
MGIERHVYGEFGDSRSKGAQIKLNTTGIDIEDLSQLTPLNDHTLTFKGQRVVLYIRDVSNWSDEIRLPKFHVAYCSTLQKMVGHGKKKRYVVSQNESNLFHLNLINGRKVEKSEQKLSVCRNCLEALRWNNYSKRMSQSGKDTCVNNFKVEEFFSKYSKNLINEKEFSKKNSPINQYPSNWQQISSSYREYKRWVCEQCAVKLNNNKHLLHTHHINSQKNENSYSNLMALCVECHASQYMHEHMYNNPETSVSILAISELRKEQGIT